MADPRLKQLVNPPPGGPSYPPTPAPAPATTPAVPPKAGASTLPPGYGGTGIIGAPNSKQTFGTGAYGQGVGYRAPTPFTKQPLGVLKNTIGGGPGGKGPGSGTSGTPADPYGTESGPGILQQWFNERANGTDPGYEYAMKRNSENLANKFAAGGSFNSGAAGQAQGDMLANMAAQREGQLDTLAAGASGEHQGAVNSMFNTGLGLAGGESGTMGQYDLGAAGALSQSSMAQIMLALNKAGVTGQAAQNWINLITQGGKAMAAGGGGG